MVSSKQNFDTALTTKQALLEWREVEASLLRRRFSPPRYEIERFADRRQANLALRNAELMENWHHAQTDGRCFRIAGPHD
jgi:hypothetical protein